MIENVIQYFKERINLEKQICNLPTCEECVKNKKIKKIEYISLAIKALEKQIPKKPRFYAGNYYCPKCDDLVGCHDTIMKWDNKYCKNCGQKIEWIGEQND